MFLIVVTYVKPIEVIDQHLAEHRKFLAECYQKNYLIVSGPQNPRTGGIIISQLKDRNILEEVIKQDPFYQHKVARFDITEFTPVLFHPDFKTFV